MKKKATAAGSSFLLILGALLVVLVVGEEPPPLCSDGIDNDGDGGTDQTDNECYYQPPADPFAEPGSNQWTYCAAWNNEMNPPQNMQQCTDGY